MLTTFHGSLRSAAVQPSPMTGRFLLLVPPPSSGAAYSFGVFASFKQLSSLKSRGGEVVSHFCRAVTFGLFSKQLYQARTRVRNLYVEHRV